MGRRMVPEVPQVTVDLVVPAVGLTGILVDTLIDVLQGFLPGGGVPEPQQRKGRKKKKSKE